MDVRASLIGSIEEVLDKMAFMFFDETSEAQGEAYLLTTEVNVTGVVSGRLNIQVTESAAKEIARNLIGIRDEDDLHRGTLEDALREFTNLVMGRTMTILNPAGPFDMEIPRIVEEPSASVPSETELDVAGALDDEPMRVLFRYRETPV